MEHGNPVSHARLREGVRSDEGSPRGNGGTLPWVPQVPRTTSRLVSRCLTSPLGGGVWVVPYLLPSPVGRTPPRDSGRHTPVPRTGTVSGTEDQESPVPTNTKHPTLDRGCVSRVDLTTHSYEERTLRSGTPPKNRDIQQSRGHTSPRTRDTCASSRVRDTPRGRRRILPRTGVPRLDTPTVRGPRFPDLHDSVSEPSTSRDPISRRPGTLSVTATP